MSHVSKSEFQILEANSALTFSFLCLSDAISPHFDHQAFGFSRGLRAARFHRLSEFLSEDWTSSSVMADGCWYTPRLILSQIFTFPGKKKYTHTHTNHCTVLYEEVSLSRSHLQKTHTNTHASTADLKVGNPVSCEIHCGKSLPAGSPAGTWTVKMTPKKSPSALCIWFDNQL